MVASKNVNEAQKEVVLIFNGNSFLTHEAVNRMFIRLSDIEKKLLKEGRQGFVQDNKTIEK